jgi:rhamnose utilization protein RhaD (predicted bifunctional aldolase and dehydrogenase)
MTPTAALPATLKFLEDRWDPAVAATLDEPELLRYRSNLLGSDLRLTNFAGGNTSSKVTESDPLTGEPVKVLWVKGSGGDLGSIKRSGFATLYLDKLLSLERSYKGVDLEDEMVPMYAIASFRNNPVASSIDTPLHGYLPYPHVDHLHPDWGIALAASANGLAKMEEFNREFNHHLVWVPWQRPGFELGLMMRKAVLDNPGCDGIVLGGHGLFTWGETQRECYLNTITLIDQIGQFIERHGLMKGATRFGSEHVPARENRSQLSVQIAPYLRGRTPGIWRSSAPAALTTSSAPRFARFLSRGRQALTLPSSNRRSIRRWMNTASSTPSITTPSPPRTRPPCATPTRPSF